MPLVLTRKANQSIQIDGDIIVTVVETHSGKVKLSIDAPPEVEIRRTELLDTSEPELAGREKVSRE